MQVVLLLLMIVPSRTFSILLHGQHRTFTGRSQRRPFRFSSITTNLAAGGAKMNTSQPDASRRRNGGILMILSPAKTLDLTSPVPYDLPLTQPDCSRGQTAAIAAAMKSLSPSALTKTLQISSAQLGQTAAEHWQNFVVDDPNDKAAVLEKPCIYTYSGAAYQGLDVYNNHTCFTQEQVLYLQQHLRILSAVYGVLRPLDVIQPYRLEMGMLLPRLDSKKDKIKLAQYWSEAVTKRLLEDLLLLDGGTQSSSNTEEEEDNNNDGARSSHGPILLNLASEEYAAAVDVKALRQSMPHCRYIKVVFRDNGRVIAVHAKRARGLMVRYLAQHNVQDLDGIRSFDSEGYRLVADQSDETTLVYNRSKQQAVAPAARKRAAAATTTTSRKGSTKKTKS